MCVPGLILPRGSLRLDTRRGSHIDNYYDNSDCPGGVDQESQDFRDRYRECEHRPTRPTFVYNCHGLTFGSRRTQITDPVTLRKILEEDRYQPVILREVCRGDIVIYVGDLNEIIHSGFVVAVDRNDQLTSPWLLSKWGGAHEVIHRVGDCPYAAGARIEYFRIVR